MNPEPHLVSLGCAPCSTETSALNAAEGSALAEMERRLRAARLESVRQLASGLAHDLNNILTPIMMATHMLAEQVRGKENQELLDTITASAERAAEVVRQVLLFARGASGQRTVVQLGSVLAAVRDLIVQGFPRNVQVEASIPPDLWPIHGDAAQLRQVVLNLCTNARDAMPLGGTLALSAENLSLDAALPTADNVLAPGPYVKVRVADTGAGIDPAIQDRIFEPFFTTKEFGRGNGMGLAVVLGVARGHGGGVRAFNGSAGGAVFEVFLPPARAESPAPPEPAPGSGTKQTRQILVVDDDALVRQVAEMTLKAHGFDVLIAEDGTSGLAAFVRHQDSIAAVLSDTMMPEMDGVEMIRLLRQLAPRIPIVSASGFADEARLLELKRLEVTAFLPKPYNPEHLLRTMSEVLQQANPA